VVTLIVRNGFVVTPEGVIPADVAIEKDKVVAISAWGAFGDSQQTVDAAGRFVLPGLVDPHVHMSHPFRGELSKDDFYSGTVSAAFGGTTTIIDFAIQWDKSASLSECLAQRRQQADGEVVIDYALHPVPTRSSQETIDEAAALASAGIGSLKIYMIYREQGRMLDDAMLFGLLSELGERGGLVMVHAENSPLAEFNQHSFLSSGHNRPSDFPLVKPNIVEAEAVHRALYLSRHAGGYLYLVHLSTAESVELVAARKAAGDDVVAETCPQYLTLSSEVYDRADGGRFICSPPIRSHQDSEALWDGLSKGTISVIASDHCGFDAEQKDRGQGDYSQTPHGLPGIELRLPLVYTHGVLKDRISVCRMVELLSTNPAKVFGLYPRKGALLPGSDADLVILNVDEDRAISGAAMHGAVKWSPYEGMHLRGFASTTIARGKLIVQDGEFLGVRGDGHYLEERTSRPPSGPRATHASPAGKRASIS